MTSAQLIATIRAAQAQGKQSITARVTHAPLDRRVRIVEMIITGGYNGNPHDVWVNTKRSGETVGRIYLGSKNHAADTNGWEDRIQQWL